MPDTIYQIFTVTPEGQEYYVRTHAMYFKAYNEADEIVKNIAKINGWGSGTKEVNWNQSIIWNGPNDKAIVKLYVREVQN